MRHFGVCNSCGQGRNQGNTRLVIIDDDFEFRECRCGKSFTARKVLAPDCVTVEGYETWTCKVCPDDLRYEHRRDLGLVSDDTGADLDATGSFYITKQDEDDYHIEVIDLTVFGRGDTTEVNLGRVHLDCDLIAGHLREQIDFSQWESDKADALLEHAFESIKESL